MTACGPRSGNCFLGRTPLWRAFATARFRDSLNSEPSGEAHFPLRRRKLSAFAHRVTYRPYTGQMLPRRFVTSVPVCFPGLAANRRVSLGLGGGFVEDPLTAVDGGLLEVTGKSVSLDAARGILLPASCRNEHPSSLAVKPWGCFLLGER